MNWSRAMFGAWLAFTVYWSAVTVYLLVSQWPVTYRFAKYDMIAKDGTMPKGAGRGVDCAEELKRSASVN